VPKERIFNQGYNLFMMQEAQELLKKALAPPEKERADPSGQFDR